MKLFVENGLDVHIRNNMGETPLLLFLKYGTPASDIPNNKGIVSVDIDYLISAGSSVNYQTLEGLSPLHVTCDVDQAKLLIVNGAQVNQVDNMGESPLMTAIKRNTPGSIKVAKYITI